MEIIQRRAAKLVKGLDGNVCEEWLRSLGLFCLKKWRLWRSLVVAYSLRTRGAKALISALW